jgi:protein O-mannosyl-transferase
MSEKKEEMKKVIVPHKKGFDIRNTGLLILLALSILLVYGQVYNYDFINVDDDKYVYENVIVQRGLNPESIIDSFTSTNGTGLWIPVTWISFLFDYSLFGLQPGWYHLINVLFHLLSTLILFLFLRKITGYTTRSFFVAALFALHPLHVESVAWITERKDVLSIFFMMAALLMYAKYVERLTLGRYIPVIILFSLGIMAKPMIITFPYILLLLDWWLLRRFKIAGKVIDRNSISSMKIEPVTNTRIIIEKIPFFIISAIVSGITFYAAKTGNALISLENYSFSQRLQESVVSYALYIWKTIIPVHLAVFYPHRNVAIPLWEIVCAGLFLVGVTVLVIRFARRYPSVIFGWLWYLGALLPVIGIFQAGEQKMADRFMYMPIIGLFIMGVWGVSESLKNWRHSKNILPILFTAVILTCGSLTWVQLHYWKNSYTLLTHALEVTSNNSLAHNNLGLYLSTHGDREDALIHYREALKINPWQPEAHNNIGIILNEEGKTAEALEHFREALKLSPNFEKAQQNIAIVYADQGMTDEALIHFNETLKLNPNNYKALMGIGILWQNRGDNGKALKYYREALKLDPGITGIHYNIGIILYGEGRIDEALTYFQEELRLNPNFAEAYCYMGNILVKQNKFEEALIRYKEAIRLKPDFLDARNNLLYVYKRLGNTEEAARQENEILRLKQQKK